MTQYIICMSVYETTLIQVPVVQRVGSTIHWTNQYPLDNSIGFDSTYPVESDPSTEQLIIFNTR